MTENHRIALNVFFSYLRSLYTIVLGLLSGRWCLMALGCTDYGLIGVIGGAVGFVSFFNTLLASAVGRFYAFSVGASNKQKSKAALEECRKWFNTAFFLHSILSFALICIGYPIGYWAIKHYLVIPLDRIAECVWVWRFTCISCFMGMFNVPFQAMYTAKQEIAELTIYSFITSTLNFLFLYYMVTHPAHWLVRYMAWSSALVVVPQIIISIRALCKYKECVFNIHYFWDIVRVQQLIIFVGGRFICASSQLLSTSGLTILVNKMLGPMKNATMSIGNAVASHSATLSQAFTGSLSPAITNAAGAQDFDKMRKLIYDTCALATAAVLIFALPLAVEMDSIMVLWLKTPPPGCDIIAIALLLVALGDRISDGLWMGVFAMGRIAVFQILEALVYILVLPIAYVFIRNGFDVFGIGIGLVLTKILSIPVKLYFAKTICGISVKTWLLRILFPSSLISVMALLSGFSVRYLLPSSFVRVILTTISIEIVFLPLVWALLLPRDYKSKLIGQISKRFR